MAHDHFNVVTALSLSGAAKALTLGRLMRCVVGTPGAVDSATASTALQLAIWNIVHDNDLSLATGGSFADSNSDDFHATKLLIWSPDRR